MKAVIFISYIVKMSACIFCRN